MALAKEAAKTKAKALYIREALPLCVIASKLGASERSVIR